MRVCDMCVRCEDREITSHGREIPRGAEHYAALFGYIRWTVRLFVTTGLFLLQAARTRRRLRAPPPELGQAGATVDAHAAQAFLKHFGLDGERAPAPR